MTAAAASAVSSPQQRQANARMLKLLRSGNLKEANDLFTEMQTRADSQPDVFTYSMLIHAWMHNSTHDRLGYERALCLFSDMHAHKVQPNKFTFTALLSGLSRRHMVAEAEQLFESLKHGGHETGVELYNVMIKLYVQEGRMERANGLVEELGARGIVPTMTTFSILLRGHAGRGDLKSVVEVSDRMQEVHSIPMDLNTLNALVDGFAKNSMIDEASSLIEALTAHHTDLKPNIVTYTPLIHYMLRNRELDKAIEVLRKIQQNGLVPDTPIYNQFLEYKLTHESEQAVEEHLKLMENNKSVNNLTYVVLIQHYYQRGKIDIALKHIMRLRPICKLNEKCYSLLIFKYASTRKWDTIASFFKNMVEDGVQPPFVASLHLFDAFAKTNDWAQYQTLLQSMTARRGHSFKLPRRVFKMLKDRQYISPEQMNKEQPKM